MSLLHSSLVVIADMSSHLESNKIVSFIVMVKAAIPRFSFRIWIRIHAHKILMRMPYSMYPPRHSLIMALELSKIRVSAL